MVDHFDPVAVSLMQDVHPQVTWLTSRSGLPARQQPSARRAVRFFLRRRRFVQRSSAADPAVDLDEEMARSWCIVSSFECRKNKL